MALKATVFKFSLQVSDLDRHYYAGHELTLARHPSETDERMLARLLLFALHADPNLRFGKGLSTAEEPDLWRISDSGEVDTWIDLGQPDEKRLRRACGRARQVFVYTYNDRSAPVWWQKNAAGLERFRNLGVRHLPGTGLAELAQLAAHGTHLNVNIQDGELWLSKDSESVHLVPQVLRDPVA